MVSSPFGGVDHVNDTLLLRNVLATLDVSLAGQRVLDVGCGRGYTGEVIEAAGGAYFGVDTLASRTGFKLALAEAEALPFANESFDRVCCIDAFEHFIDQGRAAREFRRVLRPDGCVFLSAPNYANIAGLVKKFSEAVGGYEKNSWAPFRNWQPQALEQMLTPNRVKRVFRDAGFPRMRWIGHSAEAGLGLFPWIEHPRMPEALKFRLQRFWGLIGPAISARLARRKSAHLLEDRGMR